MKSQKLIMRGMILVQIFMEESSCIELTLMSFIEILKSEGLNPPAMTLDTPPTMHWLAREGACCLESDRVTVVPLERHSVLTSHLGPAACAQDYLTLCRTKGRSHYTPRGLEYHLLFLKMTPRRGTRWGMKGCT